MKFFPFLFLSLFLYAKDSIDFDLLLKKTIKSNLSLKIAHYDVLINQEKIYEFTSNYFPTLNLIANSAYDNVDIGESGLATINNTVLRTRENYQNSVSLQFNYELIDYGFVQRKSLVLDKKVSSVEIFLLVKKMALTLLDYYAKALLLKNDLEKYHKLQAIYQQMYKAQKELFIAGEIDKISLADSAIKVIDVGENIQKIQHQEIKAFQELSMFSHEDLDPKKSVLSVFHVKKVHKLYYEQSNEYKKFQLLLEKKETEITINENSLSPKVNFYARYNYYQSDDDYYYKVFMMDPSGYSLGFSINITLFEGLKYFQTAKRLKLESQKIKLQIQESKESFEFEVQRLNRDIYNYQTEISSHTVFAKKQKEKDALVSAYQEQDLINTSFSLQIKADNVEKHYEEQKLQIEKNIALKKLDYLNPRKLYKEYE